MPPLTMAQKSGIKEIAAAHKVESIKVFGSEVRGAARPDSDLDLLVRFSGTTTLVELVRLKQALEEFLKRPVDLLEEGALSRHFAGRIMAEAMDL